MPRERKLRKFTGVRDDHLIEDWILDTKRGISSQSEADAVDFLLYHLQGAAKEELRLRPDEEKNTPEALSRVLRSSFGEGRISTQAMRKFFERREEGKGVRTALLSFADGAPVAGGKPQPWCSN